MVVGSVQSGKTANYVGVVTKALDAGYKIIIILAGIHNNLRSQTQKRIDEGILGFDSQREGDANRPDSKIGVGKLFLPDLGQIPPINTLTSSAENGDFTAGAQRVNVSIAGDPLILVIKKNVSPLKNVLKWLKVAGDRLGHQGCDEPIRDIPLLLIDDEADNASINTKDKPSADPDDETNITSINRSLRLILQRFEKSTYIGYTATPFANIFINPEAKRDEEGKDLFPRDFIVNVRPSSRYIGPSKMFGYRKDLDAGIDEILALPLFRPVTDDDLYFPPGHKIDHDPFAFPESLKTAIHSFILSCAGRRARGQRKVHNSMLIHVTRFTAVQAKVKALIDSEFVSIRNSIRYDRGNEIWRTLKELWETDFCDCIGKIQYLEADSRLTPLSWEDVEQELPTAVDKICIREIHGQSTDDLNYDKEPEGLSVIAVGGNKLSRGLTLEGLSVSYFLRATKMYDTLMQMGRWFGYRDGYIDLCRLYTTHELREWFSHVAFAEEELKREFEYMANARLTPSDYGLRVRQHPDGMMVTALNKMAHGESRQVTFAGQLVQTAFFTRDEKIQLQRRQSVETWLKLLGGFRKDQKGYLRWTASRDEVLSLLTTFSQKGFTDSRCSGFGPEVAEYIKEQIKSGGLEEWRVIVPSGESSLQQIAGREFRTIKRTDKTPEESYYSLRNSNVQDPSHEILDLDEIILTDEIADEILRKLEVRAGNATTPLIKQGTETDCLRQFIGKPIADAVVALGRLREKTKKTKPGAIRNEIRQLRPIGRGLLILYMLDTSTIAGLQKVGSIPAFVMSFPATDRARKVDYRVNATWLKTQLQRFNIDDDE